MILGASEPLSLLLSLFQFNNRSVIIERCEVLETKKEKMCPYF